MKNILTLANVSEHCTIFHFIWNKLKRLKQLPTLTTLWFNLKKDICTGACVCGSKINNNYINNSLNIVIGEIIIISIKITNQQNTIGLSYHSCGTLDTCQKNGWLSSAGAVATEEGCEVISEMIEERFTQRSEAVVYPALIRNPFVSGTEHIAYQQLQPFAFLVYNIGFEKAPTKIVGIRHCLQNNLRRLPPAARGFLLSQIKAVMRYGLSFNSHTFSKPQRALLPEPSHRKQRYPIPIRKHHFVVAQIFFRTIYYTKKVWRVCYFIWSFLSCWGWMKANVNQRSELRLCTTYSESLPLIITQVNWISLQHRLPDDSLSTEVQKWSSRCNNICT